MSQYAYLTCVQCKEMLWLGKVVRAVNGSVDRFHIGDADEPVNAARVPLNEALWQFLAESAGHPLRVVIEGEPGYEELDQYIDIAPQPTSTPEPEG